ncbi:MAG: UDP-3-O-(3-hydroxymyristoyl)glucosamine N-acyltransferase [Pseudomonadota bacterium]
MTATSVFTLGELAARLGARLVGGEEHCEISGLASLDQAGPGTLSHLSSVAFAASLETTRAGAVLLREGDAACCPVPALVVDDPYLAFARASQLFERVPPIDAGPQGVHPDAVIGADVVRGVDCQIGPQVVIGDGTRLGDRVRLHPHVSLGSGCVVGDDVELHPNAVIGARVRIGARSVIHPGAVIGAEGFGFAPDAQGRLERIAQLGSVVIGSDVSVGANSTVDRGALEDTVIGEGVKIDNQVQIGHNCHIGDHSVICGCSGLVGSTRLGRHCVLGGGVGIGGDGPITLCDGVTISGMTHVSQSISEPGVYSGGVLHGPTRQWKRNALRFTRIDELFRRVARLERRS